MAPEDQHERSGMQDLTDFASLQRPSSPNSWLIVSPGLGKQVAADAEVPAYQMTPRQLAAAWQTVVETQPRTRILAVSDNGLQIEAVQRSALFGFIDRISFQAVPIDEDSAGLLVYSRSNVGYWDMGVNRRRLSAWIEAIDNATPR